MLFIVFDSKKWAKTILLVIFGMTGAFKKNAI